MYFNNCQFAINAQNKSKIKILDGAAFFNNISGSGINLENDSMLVALGVSGATGITSAGSTANSLYIANSNAGINAKNSTLNVRNSQILGTPYGVLATNSTFSVNDSYISKPFSTVGIGVFADNGSVGNVNGTSVTGFNPLTGSTGSTAGASFKSSNYSTMTTDNTTTLNSINKAVLGNATVNNNASIVNFPGQYKKSLDGIPNLD